jgi:hypothetical protein
VSSLVTTTGSSIAPPPVCPSLSGVAAALPKGFPDDLPLPAGSRVLSTAVVGSGRTVRTARLQLPLGFRDSVKFFLAQLPAKGYVVGTGDAEAEEADIPAAQGHTSVTIKVRALPDACRSEALITVGGQADGPGES